MCDVCGGPISSDNELKHLHLYAPPTDERKIIVRFSLYKNENIKGLDDVRAVDKWGHVRMLEAEVEDAPKHTDEEVEDILKTWHDQVMRQYGMIEELKARIKELEAKSCDKCEWGRSLGFLPSRAHLKDFTISFDDDEEDKI
jgi:hypothetical protein